jgi:hypothetical protein
MTTGILSRTLARAAMSLIGASSAIVLQNAALSAKPVDGAGERAEASEMSFPRSVFVYDDGAGKDPFFPDRQRPDDRSAAKKAVEPAKQESLTLRGIAGSAGRKVALINGRPFAKGETGEIKVGTNTFRIRVADIKEKSATIERDGQTNELQLVESLLPINSEK